MHCDCYYKSREQWDHRFKLCARRMHAIFIHDFVYFTRCLLVTWQINYYEISAAVSVIMVSGFMDSVMFSTNVCTTAQMAEVGMISCCCHLYASSNYSRRAMHCHL